MDSTRVDPERLAQQLSAAQPLPDGDSWVVSAYENAPGWFVACPHDAMGLPYVGAITLHGPDRRVLELSSNPGVHGFDETAAVIGELADSDLADADLVAEIHARTARK